MLKNQAPLTKTKQTHKDKALPESDFEAICQRCGACCGAYDGDPCEHLRKGSEGRYFCVIYDHRFGIHHTINGHELECVPITEKLKDPWIGDGLCAYKQLYLDGKLKL